MMTNNTTNAQSHETTTCHEFDFPRFCSLGSRVFTRVSGCNTPDKRRHSDTPLIPFLDSVRINNTLTTLTLFNSPLSCASSRKCQ